MHIKFLKNIVFVLCLTLSSTAYGDKINNDGETPLYRAVYEEDIDRVRTLLSQGADPNQERENTSFLHPGTPLERAVKSNNYDLFKLLVQSGGDIKRRNSAGLFPAHYSVYYSHTDLRILEYLLNNAYETFAPNEKVLLTFFAQTYDVQGSFNEKAARLLIENGLPPGEQKNPRVQIPLMGAIASNNPAAVKFFAQYSSKESIKKAIKTAKMNKKNIQKFYKNSQEVEDFVEKADKIIAELEHLVSKDEPAPSTAE